ncbi:MAG: MerR family transcriptional regulator [Dehalococcoidia bacterium]|jgi:DNA-binding transcriptional MerR regulator|nr:MerR family transcriptional regulator [Dehalococcoidia bacterium]HJN59374.1 MerR family transcriptional regulator [Dehalococcoidia bacterium]
MDNNSISIGKLSKITGLTTSAINFYIRNKVIPPPLKTSKTRALFPESSVELLKNIVKMRNEKIPLKMIKYILNDSSDQKSEKNKDDSQQQKIKSLAAKNLNEFLELTGLEKFLFDVLVEKSIIRKPQKDNNNNIYFNYSEISLGKSIKELIDNGIPLEVIERHSEYEPLSEAEALFLLEHLKNSRSYNQETKEKIIGDFEIIRNIMRLNKLRELEQRLI